MKKKLMSWVILIGLMSAGSAAVAYHTHGRWTYAHATLYASAQSFPAGNAYRTALTSVVNAFNRNPSDFRMRQRYDEPSIGLNNLESEVWFSNDSDYDPAWTFYTYLPGSIIIEADIVFYTGEDYTANLIKLDLWPYGGGHRPFHTTALHEYGHAAGLSHESQEYNIMGADYTHIGVSGPRAYAYLGEDAAHGLVSRYTHRDGVAIENVSVNLFKWVGVNGEYSVHDKCTMTDGGVELTYTNYSGQRRYNVDQGQRVRVWFTYENSGESTQTMNVGYYISTDSGIGTNDRLIDTRTFTQKRNNVDTRYVTLTIPADLVSGTTYWLGAIADYDRAIAEVEEQNTAAHIIRVN